MNSNSESRKAIIERAIKQTQDELRRLQQTPPEHIRRILAKAMEDLAAIVKASGREAK